MWTLPNLLSAARLSAGPLIAWLLLGADERLWSAVILAVVCATDFLDGQLARRLGQVSEIGKVLDPAADRVVLSCVVIAAVIQGDVPIWLALVLASREVLVSAGALALATRKAPHIDVIGAGKAGTFLLMTALPLFIAGHSRIGWHGVADGLGWASVAIGAVLAWYAAFAYVPMARRALETARVGRPT